MPVRNLVGIQIEDPDQYAEYREQLGPVLDEFGATFVFDVSVAETHRSADGGHFNRLFLMEFPSTEVAQQFMQDARYLELRDRLFVPSVSRTALLGRWTP